MSKRYYSTSEAVWPSFVATDPATVDTTGWVPYDGVYPLREEGWLMAPDPEPIEDDDTPLATTDEVTVETKTTVSPSSENDDDQPSEKEKPA